MPANAERQSGAGSDKTVLRRFGIVILHVPKYMLLATNLARDGRISGAQKAGTLVSLGYAISPIDLLPGIVPVVGQLDDLAVLIGGLRAVLRRCPPGIAAEHLERAGLSFDVMDADLNTVRDTAWWLAKRGGKLLGRAAWAALRGSLRLAGNVGKTLQELRSPRNQ